MLGHKGKPSGKFGQKGVPPFSHIGSMNKSHESGEVSKNKVKEMIAQAAKYGSLEKK
jgi:hypothetical protein